MAPARCNRRRLLRRSSALLPSSLHSAGRLHGCFGAADASALGSAPPRAAGGAGGAGEAGGGDRRLPRRHGGSHAVRGSQNQQPA